LKLSTSRGVREKRRDRTSRYTPPASGDSWRPETGDRRYAFECMDWLSGPSRYRRRPTSQRWSRRGRGGAAAMSLAIAIKDESVQCLTERCTVVRQYDAVFLCRQWILLIGDGQTGLTHVLAFLEYNGWRRFKHKHVLLFEEK